MKTIQPPHSDTGVADEVLREVWRIKDELSAQSGHDLNRLFAEAREHQRQSGRRSVTLSQKTDGQGA